MSGLSIMCQPGTPHAHIDANTGTGTTATADTAGPSGHVYDPGVLSAAQAMGDACVICHVRWPRPRHPLGELPDGSPVHGCAECAGIVESYAARSSADRERAVALS